MSPLSFAVLASTVAVKRRRVVITPDNDCMTVCVCLCAYVCVLGMHLSFKYVNVFTRNP